MTKRDAKRASPVGELLRDGPRVVNLGLEAFAQALRAAGAQVVSTDWRPPAGGDPALAWLLDSLRDESGENWREPIASANREAVRRLLSAWPVLRGVGVAADVVPGMRNDLVLHAGPPVSWERMCGPMRGAVVGGLLYEGLAKSPAEAEKLAASGKIAFEPCHHHQAVGPMAGVTTASMPVWIVENEAFGNRSFSTLNEGLGKVLRYGAYAPEVIERLRWMKDILAPALGRALEARGGLDLRTLIAQALLMGDELHNRNRAATSLFIREIAPHLVGLGLPTADLSRILEFLNSNDHFALNLSMAAAKASLDPASDVRASSMVTVMSRNGTEFGIRVAGLGDRWFTAPAPEVEGLYLPGFSREDAARDIGDSAITETAGYGGFAMAAAPAIVKFVGGTAEEALGITRRMAGITLAESDVYRIPALDFRGTPTGIDALAVAESGVLPVINTGIAHKEPGIGMVGAGLVRPPASLFRDAARALVETLRESPARRDASKG
jgi:hypothetical protein